MVLCARAWSSLPKINNVQVKAFVTFEVPLLSEFGIITALEVWKRGND